MPDEFGDGDWLGVTKTVTVGTGVGIGFTGINESRGTASGPLSTTLTNEMAEKFAKNRTTAV